MPSEPWRNPRPAPQLEEIRARVPAKSMLPGWFRAWWPALLWSVVIFTASTDSFSSAHTGSFFEPLLLWLHPSFTHQQIEFIHHVVRKLAHLSEYFIFFLLLYRGLRGHRRGWYWSSAFAAWFLATAYACLDEIHQSFVASRSASPLDSLLDSIGAATALLLLYLYYAKFRPAFIKPRSPL
jgi:VanZ family protein